MARSLKKHEREVLVTDFGVVEVPERLPVRMTVWGNPDRRYREAPLCSAYIQAVQAAAQDAYVNGRDLLTHAVPYSSWKASRG